MEDFSWNSRSGIENQNPQRANLSNVTMRSKDPEADYSFCGESTGKAKDIEQTILQLVLNLFACLFSGSASPSKRTRELTTTEEMSLLSLSDFTQSYDQSHHKAHHKASIIRSRPQSYDQSHHVNNFSSIVSGNNTMAEWQMTDDTPFRTEHSNIFSTNDSYMTDSSSGTSSMITFNFTDILDSPIFIPPSTRESTSTSTTTSMSCGGRSLLELCLRSISVEGFQLTLNHRKINGLDLLDDKADICQLVSDDSIAAWIHCLYYCKERRNPVNGKKCLFSLTLDINYHDFTDVKRKSKGVHICGQDSKAFVDSQGAFDYGPEMEARVLQELRKVGLAQNPNTIALNVYNEFEKKAAGTLHNLSTISRLKCVLKTARHEDNKDALVIYQPPLCQCGAADGRNFLLFDIRYTRTSPKVKINGEFARLLGFGNAKLISEIWGCDSDLFLDSTFRVVPFGFYQVLILMAYVKRWNMFVPIWYVLMTNKDKESYSRALDGIVRSAKGNGQHQYLKAKTVMTDFEAAEISAVKEELKPTYTLGCCFHWKQCQSGKLKQLGVHPEILWNLVGIYDSESGVGLLEMLTFINPAEIESKGIPYIQRTLTASGVTQGYESEMEEYWIYFVKTWVHTFEPLTWNVYHLITDEHGNRKATFEGLSEEECQLFQRTNNCLERFNREMNEAFPVSHPNLFQFIETIKDKSNKYVDIIRRMEAGHEQPYSHNTTLIFGYPPSDY